MHSNYRIFDYATLIAYYKSSNYLEMSRFKAQSMLDSSLGFKPKDVNQWLQKVVNQCIDHYSILIKYQR